MASKMDIEMTKRGVDTCTRIIPLRVAQVRNFYAYGLSISPTLKAVPGPFQYKIDVPKNAESMTVYVQKTYGWGGGMGAYIRVGKEVGYDYVGPLYDHVKDTQVGSLTLSVGDTTGKAKLVPGATYYVLPLNTAHYTSVGSISITIKEKSVLPPDAAVPPPADSGAPIGDGATVPQTDTISLPNPLNPDDSANDRGCSCTVNGSGEGAGTGLALLLVLGVFLIRRKRP